MRPVGIVPREDLMLGVRSGSTGHRSAGYHAFKRLTEKPFCTPLEMVIR